MQKIKNNLKKYSIWYIAFGIVAVFFAILGLKYGFTQAGILTGLEELNIIMDANSQKTVIIANKILNILILVLTCTILFREGLDIFKKQFYKKFNIEDDFYENIVDSFLELKGSKEGVKDLLKVLTLLILFFLFDKLSSVGSLDYAAGYEMFKNISSYIVILVLYYSGISSAKVSLMENIGNLKDDEMIDFTAFLNSNEDIESKSDADMLMQYIKKVKSEGNIEDKTYKMAKFRSKLTIFAFIIAITQTVLTFSNL